MFKGRIVGLGASAGGVGALQQVIGSLAPDFPAAILVVLHIPPYQASSLPAILTRAGPLPASHAEDGEKVRGGHIYVAPPDHHLLLDRGSLAVKRGPKENRFRPSIDALFRSIAYTLGPRAIGVVLSGALDDGTSGLWSIKRLGGVAVVQQPSEAQFETMPESALQQVEVDFNIPAGEIGPLLTRLVTIDAPEVPQADDKLRKRMGIEISIAAEDAAFQKGVIGLRSSRAGRTTSNNARRSCTTSCCSTKA